MANFLVFVFAMMVLAFTTVVGVRLLSDPDHAKRVSEHVACVGGFDTNGNFMEYAR
jgi:hypothetical protein